MEAYVTVVHVVLRNSLRSQ